MKILMVCLGNICRSPLAEGIMKTKVSDGFLIDSAGIISMHQGEHPDRRAVKVAANHGIDISEQKSRPINQADFETFDKIYCMDSDVMADVLSKVKNEAHKEKVFLFLEQLNSENLDVPDPYWGDMKDFEMVFKLLDKGCDAIAQQLNNEN